MEAVKLLHVLLQDEAGVTAIEYALLGVLIAMAIIGGASTLGLNLGIFYDTVSGEVLDAIS